MTSRKFKCGEWHTYGYGRVAEVEVVVLVVVASSTVACGGWRKLLKLSEFTLQLLLTRPLLRRIVWMGFCRQGEVNDGAKVA